MAKQLDFIVVGAGVVGAAIARNLVGRLGRTGSVALLDKSHSASIPEHASGRNSGVLHAGFYYTADSLKAKLTRAGNVFLHDYCGEKSIAINNCGKLVIPTSDEEQHVLDVLFERAAANGVPVERVGPREISELEPLASSERGGLWSPTTAAADPSAVSRAILQDALDGGAQLLPHTAVAGLSPQRGGGVRVTASDGSQLHAKHVINAAGLHADTLAHQLGFGEQYRIVPFKGLYMYCQGLPLRRLVYPVPDVKQPFLGVHFTVTVDGRVKIGPTAMPAFWREQYRGLSNFSLREAADIAGTHARLMFGSSFGFPQLAARELAKHIPAVMQRGANALVPSAAPRNFGENGRAGIRAQLVNTASLSLEMDFVVQGDAHSTHILNAVSPGWTCAVPFAEYVVSTHIAPSTGL